MIIVDLEQGSPEWFKEKLGKPSASNASKIITNLGKPSTQQTSYMYELAAEAVTNKREEGYKNDAMSIGLEREEESRQLYEITNNLEVKKVGLIYKDEHKLFCCSPDGLINESHGLELKNVLPKTQVKYLLDGDLPSEYFGQVQFSMMVTGLKFWDFFSYSPGLKPLLVRVSRDEKYISALESELGKFCDELEAIVQRIK